MTWRFVESTRFDDRAQIAMGVLMARATTNDPLPIKMRSVSDEQEDDFATMFEASVKPRQFEQGQTVEGTIVAFGSEVAFVSVGGKSEAQIDLAELKDDAGHVEVSIGDRIQARVVSTSGGITLSRKGVRNAATQRELEDAFATGIA